MAGAPRLEGVRAGPGSTRGVPEEEAHGQGRAPTTPRYLPEGPATEGMRVQRPGPRGRGGRHVWLARGWSPDGPPRSSSTSRSRRSTAAAATAAP